MADGQLVGVEALLRWAHASQGVIPPSTVIPLAEQTGLISEIGRWVLRQACVDRRRWQPEASAARLVVAVNVSALQLMAPGFVETVAEILSTTATEPRTVTLEVTESVFIQDSDRALVVLEDLKALGVMLALDDFGTGYSSLSYLKRFPVDVVKIDRIFVSDLARDSTSRHIVAAIVSLAHALNMRVVAEGVETVAQYGAIRALECDYYQGFLLARPQPICDLAVLVSSSYDDDGGWAEPEVVHAGSVDIPRQLSLNPRFSWGDRS